VRYAEQDVKGGHTHGRPRLMPPEVLRSLLSIISNTYGLRRRGNGEKQTRKEISGRRKERNAHAIGSRLRWTLVSEAFAGESARSVLREQKRWGAEARGAERNRRDRGARNTTPCVTASAGDGRTWRGGVHAESVRLATIALEAGRACAVHAAGETLHTTHTEPPGWFMGSGAAVARVAQGASSPKRPRRPAGVRASALWRVGAPPCPE